MKRPEDEILLGDMVDHAGRASAAVAGRRRVDHVRVRQPALFLLNVTGSTATPMSPRSEFEQTSNPASARPPQAACRPDAEAGKSELLSMPESRRC